MQSPSKDRLVNITDRVVTALDLVSLILRDDTNGLLETQRIARQYNVDIVGAIPPLNVYQVRLRASTLATRESILSRMKSDPAVMGVVVEDDNLEALEDRERIVERLTMRGGPPTSSSRQSRSTRTMLVSTGGVSRQRT